MRQTIVILAIALGLGGCAAPSAEEEAFLAARQSTEAATPADPAAAISDEQDFDAVAARETIESDRERLQAQREQYRVIAPQPLPQRTGPTGPDIVAYALATTNLPGQAIYPRSTIRLMSYEQACARHPSPDRAQAAFLRDGGPRRDPQGLDPDGDGFACGWDPAPFRAALQEAPKVPQQP